MNGEPAACHILPSHAPGAIERAAEAILAGYAVAVPTETVYGLAADATRADAVARIYAAKGRPRFNPLIAHVSDVADAALEGVLDARAHALARACWPGPLTLVVPAQADGRVCELARAGLSTIALRVPGCAVTRELIAAVGRPLAAPSANVSGRLSPTVAADVAAELGERIELILDGGACAVGVESTIVAVLPGQPLTVLRPGAVTDAQIEAVTGQRPGAAAAAPDAIPSDGSLDAAEQAIVAPGQLASHYAPRATVRMNAVHARSHEVLLAFGPDAPSEALNLSPGGDTVEAAANLYAMLRQLDRSGAATIAVMPVPCEGLGVAINDRLRRAAAPRS